MSASITSLFACELEQGSHQFAPSSQGRDRGTGAVASWLRTAVSRLQTVLPISPTRTGQRHEGGAGVAARDIAAAAPTVRRIASPPRCRMCGTRGTRRVCATCATLGFIERGCGCVERPDGSRYACDAAIERGLDTPLPGDAEYGPSVRAAFDAWADAASAPSDRCAGHTTTFSDATWERLWSQR